MFLRSEDLTLTRAVRAAAARGLAAAESRRAADARKCARGSIENVFFFYKWRNIFLRKYTKNHFY